MHGIPRDGSDAFRRIVQAQKNPYEILHQFRVNAISYDGTEWSGGWTKLTHGEVRGNVWQLFGPIHHLQTGAEGLGVSDKSSVELVYDRSLRLPIPMNMVKTVYRDDKEVLRSRSSGTKTVEVIDTTIDFYCSADREHVWVVADTSPTFPHPHLENWISEPLNLLLGEVVSPKLRARNFGNGEASITLFSSSGPPAKSLTANILREDPLGADERFWNLYRDILTVIAMGLLERIFLEFYGTIWHFRCCLPNIMPRFPHYRASKGIKCSSQKGLRASKTKLQSLVSLFGFPVILEASAYSGMH